jgi:3-oxoacyl-[acyl-carrier protein] reductase
VKEGAFVFACDLNEEGLKQEYKNVSDDQIKIIKLDVSDLKQIEDSAEIVRETLKKAKNNGSIDSAELFGIVNCAGIPPVTKSALMDKDDSELRKLFEVNVYGVHRCTKALYPLMPHDNTGSIVNIASVCGTVALPFFSFYNR